MSVSVLRTMIGGGSCRGSTLRCRAGERAQQRRALVPALMSAWSVSSSAVSRSQLGLRRLGQHAGVLGRLAASASSSSRDAGGLLVAGDVFLFHWWSPCWWGWRRRVPLAWAGGAACAERSRRLELLGVAAARVVGVGGRAEPASRRVGREGDGAELADVASRDGPLGQAVGVVVGCAWASCPSRPLRP